MPRTDWGWLTTARELESWTIHHDSELLVIDKPAHLVCHPSKHGPWSSLIGAAREYLGDSVLHMPSRLDRETSGVVVFARTATLGSAMQRAVAAREVRKTYHAILVGELPEPVRVDRLIGKAIGSQVAMRRGVVEGGSAAVTDFLPLNVGGGRTLAQVSTLTGRLHQIRVHASFLGYPLLGDKIYGPDETLFLEFIEHGWGLRHRQLLHMQRHALHASTWAWNGLCFQSPLPEEWTPFLPGAETLE